jgi:hypothetical protein
MDVGGLLDPRLIRIIQTGTDEKLKESGCEPTLKPVMEVWRS